jgi:hypothetical protein
MPTFYGIGGACDVRAAALLLYADATAVDWRGEA